MLGGGACAHPDRGAAIIKMQRQMRAKIARMEYAKALKASRQGRAVSTISRAYRGLLGRRRMAHKRALVRAAKVAAEAVSVRQLFPSDLLELADAIALALADHTQPYPPAAVLGLLRIVVLMLSATADPLTVANYSGIGVRTERAVAHAEMTWDVAMKTLRRGALLLRKLRALAARPSAQRPRLLHVPHAAAELLRAYEHDPQMTHDAMRRVGAGAKACAQLLKWSRRAALVHELQREFLDEIGDVLPGWLKRQRRQRKQRRVVEAELMVLERAALVAKDARDRLQALGKAFAVPGAVADNLGAQRDACDARLVALDAEETRLRAKDVAAEEAEYRTVEEGLRAAERDVDAAAQEFRDAQEKAARRQGRRDAAAAAARGHLRGRRREARGAHAAPALPLAARAQRAQAARAESVLARGALPRGAEGEADALAALALEEQARSCATSAARRTSRASRASGSASTAPRSRSSSAPSAREGRARRAAARARAVRGGPERGARRGARQGRR